MLNSAYVDFLSVPGHEAVLTDRGLAYSFMRKAVIGDDGVSWIAWHV